MAQSGVVVLGPPAISSMQARFDDSINAVRSEQTFCCRRSIQKNYYTPTMINLFPRGRGRAVLCIRSCLEKGDGIQRIHLRLGMPRPMSFKEQKDNLRRQAGHENAAGRKDTLGERIEAIQPQEGARRTDQTFPLTKEHNDQVNRGQETSIEI
jgi:hypothetical protein